MVDCRFRKMIVFTMYKFIARPVAQLEKYYHVNNVDNASLHHCRIKIWYTLFAVLYITLCAALYITLVKPNKFRPKRNNFHFNMNENGGVQSCWYWTNPRIPLTKNPKSQCGSRGQPTKPNPQLVSPQCRWESKGSVHWPPFFYRFDKP